MSKFTARKDDFYEGFTMSFANGYTISVQFGKSNHCSRNENDEAVSAEIAIWDKDVTWYNFGGDSVRGHCSADEVATWMRKVKYCDYTGDKWVLYDRDEDVMWLNSGDEPYVYDSIEEAMEDYWGSQHKPIMVKDLPYDQKTKVLTKELNQIIL